MLELREILGNARCEEALEIMQECVKDLTKLDLLAEAGFDIDEAVKIFKAYRSSEVILTR